MCNWQVRKWADKSGYFNWFYHLYRLQCVNNTIYNMLMSACNWKSWDYIPKQGQIWHSGFVMYGALFNNESNKRDFVLFLFGHFFIIHIQSNLSIVVTWGRLTKWPLYTGDLYMKGFDFSTKYCTLVVNKHF